MSTLSEFRKRARRTDEGWAIKAGAFVSVKALYDPENIFDTVRHVPLAVPDEAIRETMRQFMIWEPYETMGKIRNAHASGNMNHLPTASFGKPPN